MNLINALLWGLFACFQGKEALRMIGETDHYAEEKMARDKNYYNLETKTD